MSVQHWWMEVRARFKGEAHQPQEYPRPLSPIMPEVITILKTLHQAGFEAYIVGGGVRDLLAGFQPKDFDVVTDARPYQVRKLFKYSRIIGRRFRLVHVRYGRRRDDFIEVATFRCGVKRKLAWWRQHSNYNNCYGTCYTDVWRRDFTMNALLYDVQRDVVIDYCDGVQDIKHRIVRIMGDPDVRFQEDSIRILRAVRLSSKLGFEIESSTAKALYNQRMLLSQASPERLYLEVIKLFYGGYGQAAWRALLEHDIVSVIFPEINECMQAAQGQCVQQFLLESFSNSDHRLMQGKHLSTAFLFAVLYWFPWEKCRRQLRSRQRRVLRKPMREMLGRHHIRIALPNRCSDAVVTIWELQSVLLKRQKSQVIQTIAHPRFRAAYDFFVLRAHVGDAPIEIAEWWTAYQAADAQRRVELLVPFDQSDQ